MKRVAIILGLLFLTKSLHAELRGIVLEITTPSHKEATTSYTVYAPAEVSIYSDGEVERKQKVSAAQAADVLKHPRLEKRSYDHNRLSQYGQTRRLNRNTGRYERQL